LVASLLVASLPGGEVTSYRSIACSEVRWRLFNKRFVVFNPRLIMNSTLLGSKLINRFRTKRGTFSPGSCDTLSRLMLLQEDCKFFLCY